MGNPPLTREPPTGADERRRRATAVAADLLRRWEEGHASPDADVIAAHPDLMPELLQELKSARVVRSALVLARKAGPAPQAAPMRLLSDAEIDAPLRAQAPTSSELAPDEPSQVRTRIPGCVLLEQIGAGGQAAVYRAVQESTGRVVAVKVMAGGSLADSRHRTRFEREAEILAALRHPHIVNILDRGRTSAGDFYFLMEFVDGRDLDEWWSSQPHTAAGTRAVLEVFVKICRALQEAHARDIVHRDLKPSNIRVDDRGEPRVLDFGLARPAWNSRAWTIAAAATRHVTVTGQLLGSVPWASPEQAAGECECLDPRSDVYSLGVMLHQALTDAFPYAVDGPLHQVLDRIAHTPATPPSARRGSRRFGRRADLDAIVLAALAKQPARRYRSAGDLAEDVDRLLSGRPISVRPAMRRRAARRAGLVAVLALAAIGSAWHVTRPPQPPTTFELPTFINSVGMKLVRLPGGTFTMGSPQRELGREPTEIEQRATVGELFIATVEVTQQQYAEVMGAPPPGQRWPGADLPAQGVTWNDAVEFCRRLSSAEGRTYRLPTEREWEYACRAGSTAPFFDSGGFEHLGWHADNSGGRVHPVGQKWANAWGLYDMHGNVQEWCQDRLSPERRSDTRAGSVARVLRGGSALLPRERGRAAARDTGMPHRSLADVGFRVVLQPAD